MSWPSAVTLPLPGVTMPQTMLISVVLPAPLGPRRAKIPPRRLSRSIALSAWQPYASVLPSALIHTLGCLRGPVSVHWADVRMLGVQPQCRAAAAYTAVEGGIQP